MKIDSPAWDEELGICLKHEIAMIPCPSCLAFKDPDVFVTVSQIDIDFTQANDVGFEIFLGDDEGWLVERIQ